MYDLVLIDNSGSTSMMLEELEEIAESVANGAEIWYFSDGVIDQVPPGFGGPTPPERLWEFVNGYRCLLLTDDGFQYDLRGTPVPPNVTVIAWPIDQPMLNVLARDGLLSLHQELARENQLS